jgi:hypothetical protein
MKPKLQSRDKNRDLFREELIDILDMSHNLCVTADLLDWSLFREAFDKEGRVSKVLLTIISPALLRRSFCLYKAQ